MARRRRLLLIGALGAAPIVAVMTLLLIVLATMGSPPATGCGGGGEDPALPDHLSFDITAEQMDNATVIVRVGQDLSIPERGLVIAIMTSLQESSLRNLTYGDRDSLGLFQQRPSQGWGTPAEILDRGKSSAAFYGLADHTTNPGLVDIAGWESMGLGEAAQAVQQSAFPEAYDKWAGDAAYLVEWIITGHDPGDGRSSPTRAVAARAATTSSSASSSSSSHAGAVDIGPVQESLQVFADALAEAFDLDAGDMAGAPAGVDDYPDHGLGAGLDVTVGADTVLGDQITQWAMENAVTYKVTYIVWRSRVWHLDDPAGTWTPMVVFGDPVRDHTTSIHFTSTDGTRSYCTGGSTPGEGDWVNPLPAGSYTLTSPFGWRRHPVTGEWRFHAGQDMGTGGSTPPIVAVAGGTVTFAGDCGCGYGLLTTIDVGGGLVMYYGHQSAISTTVGAVVSAGDPIGTVGTTGTSTGNHLHLEFRQDGTPEDPIPVLADHGVTL